jgi:hypothetical protein
VALCALALALGSCSGSSYVAIEMNMDSDLRAVVAVPSTGTKTITLLARDEPFRYPLKSLFSRDGQSLRVAIVAFSLNDIFALYPTLKDRGVSELKTIVKPDFGAPAPGAYEIPKPLRILSATIKQGGSTDVGYKEMTLDELRSDPDLRFTFKLDAAIVCRPGATSIRMFNRDDPSKVCLFDRDDGCAWRANPSKGACPSANMMAILGRSIDQSTLLREVPPRMLIDDGGRLACPLATDNMTGETLRFDCKASGGSVVSVQETPRDNAGNPWVPKAVAPGGMLGGSMGALGTAEKGALHAYRVGTEIRLERLAVETTQVFTKPAHYDEMNTPRDYRLPESEIGAPARITSDVPHAKLVISGDRGAVVLESDDSVPATLGDELTFYRVPHISTGTITVPLARRTGDIVQGPGSLVYALLDSGVLRLRPSGSELVVDAETTPAEMIDATHHPQIIVVRAGTGERAIVWLDDGRVFMFDGATKILACKVRGKVVTAYDGPRLVILDPDTRYTIDTIDLSRGSSACDAPDLVKKYLVPPNNQAVAGDLVLDVGSHAVSNDREVLVYRYDRDVGCLDLATGYSQAITLDKVFAEAVVFEDKGQTSLWGVFANPDAQDFASVQFPLLKGAQ